MDILTGMGIANLISLAMRLSKAAIYQVAIRLQHMEVDAIGLTGIQYLLIKKLAALSVLFACKEHLANDIFGIQSHLFCFRPL